MAKALQKRTAGKKKASGKKKTATKSFDLKQLLQSEMFFALLCLTGLIPAVATNTLPLIAFNPFAEGFVWAGFGLGNIFDPDIFLAWRTLFAWLLCLGLLIVYREKNRKRALLLLPLALLVLHPSAGIGSRNAYEATPSSVTHLRDYNNDAVAARIAAIETRQNRFGGAYAWLPPYLPDTGWLMHKRENVAAPLAAWQEGQGRYIADIDATKAQIAALDRQMGQLARGGFLDIARTVMRGTLQAQRNQLLERQQNLEAKLAGHNSIQNENQRLAQIYVIDLQVSTETHERWLSDKDEFWKALAYLIASTGVLLWFIWVYGLQNKTALAAIGSWSAVSLINGAWRWWGEWQLWLFAGLYPVFATALITICARFIMRAWLDNRDIYASIKADSKLRHYATVTALWAPFLAIVIAVTVWKTDIEQRLAAQLYCSDTNGTPCVVGDSVQLLNSDPDRATMRDDIHIAISRIFAKFELDLDVASASAAEGTETAIRNARQSALDAFRNVFPVNIWDYSGPDAVPDGDTCNPLRIFGKFSLRRCGYYIGMSMLNRVYQRQVNRLYVWYDGKLTAITNSAVAAGNNASETFRNGIHGQSGRVAEQAKKYADFTVLISAVLSLIQGAILLMVIVRAYLTIQARLYFRLRPPRRFAMVSPDLAERFPANPRCSPSSGSQMLLDTAGSGRVLIRRGYNPNNAITSTLLIPPKPTNWLISRSLKGSLFLKHVEPRIPSVRPDITTSQGAQFVRFRIPENAAVVFRWENFVAMSESAKLGRLMTLRLPFVTLGHIMMPTIEGPATLVLSTFGEPVISSRRTKPPSVDPFRLLAWSVGSKFGVLASSKPTSIYLDESQIEPAADCISVLDANQPGKGGLGVLREFWKLLRP